MYNLNSEPRFINIDLGIGVTTITDAEGGIVHYGRHAIKDTIPNNPLFNILNLSEKLYDILYLFRGVDVLVNATGFIEVTKSDDPNSINITFIDTGENSNTIIVSSKHDIDEIRISVDKFFKGNLEWIFDTFDELELYRKVLDIKVQPFLGQTWQIRQGKIWTSDIKIPAHKAVFYNNNFASLLNIKEYTFDDEPLNTAKQYINVLALVQEFINVKDTFKKSDNKEPGEDLIATCKIPSNVITESASIFAAAKNTWWFIADPKSRVIHPREWISDPVSQDYSVVNNAIAAIIDLMLKRMDCRVGLNVATTTLNVEPLNVQNNTVIFDIISSDKVVSTYEYTFIATEETNTGGVIISVYGDLDKLMEIGILYVNTIQNLLDLIHV